MSQSNLTILKPVQVTEKALHAARTCKVIAFRAIQTTAVTKGMGLTPRALLKPAVVPGLLKVAA